MRCPVEFILAEERAGIDAPPPSPRADALNDGSPGLNLGDETIDNLEGAFRRVREVVLSAFIYFTGPPHRARLTFSRDGRSPPPSQAARNTSAWSGSS